MEKDPNRRLDAAQALNHKFLTQDLHRTHHLKDLVLENMKNTLKTLAFKDELNNY